MAVIMSSFPAREAFNRQEASETLRATV